MDEEKRTILQEAVRDLHKNETFERALGRVLRQHGKDYEVYVNLIAAIRERAVRDQVDLVEAARRQASGP